MGMGVRRRVDGALASPPRASGRLRFVIMSTPGQDDGERGLAATRLAGAAASRTISPAWLAGWPDDIDGIARDGILTAAGPVFGGLPTSLLPARRIEE